MRAKRKKSAIVALHENKVVQTLFSVEAIVPVPIRSFVKRQVRQQ
jgi:hypothetical protein